MPTSGRIPIAVSTGDNSTSQIVRIDGGPGMWRLKTRHGRGATRRDGPDMQGGLSLADIH